MPIVIIGPDRSLITDAMELRDGYEILEASPPGNELLRIVSDDDLVIARRSCSRRFLYLDVSDSPTVWRRSTSPSSPVRVVSTSPAGFWQTPRRPSSAPSFEPIEVVADFGRQITVVELRGI
jgi:hypothetical protein